MQTSEAIQRVIGIDLGDRYSYLHELDLQTGETLSKTRLPTSPETFGNHFASISSARITLEVGAHSPWSSRLLFMNRVIRKCEMLIHFAHEISSSTVFLRGPLRNCAKRVAQSPPPM